MKRNPSIWMFCSVILAAGLLMVGSSGCSKAVEEQAAPAGQAQEKPAEEVVYTRDDPGAWGGKEDSHVPQIAYEKTETGLKVTVTVSHEMNPETPHYIMWIQLKDGQGNLLGEKQFQATDEKAEAEFELTTVPEKLVAFEKCNLHGLWKDEVDVHRPLESSAPYDPFSL